MHAVTHKRMYCGINDTASAYHYPVLYDLHSVWIIYNSLAKMEIDFNISSPTCPDPFTGGPQLTQVCKAHLFLTVLNTFVQSSPEIGDPCGRVKPQEKPGSSYDFVVIGGGAAGAAVAARLSEIPDWKVLLLEAGPDEPAGAEIPANAGVFLGTELDWKYRTTKETHACLRSNGSCPWPKGKNLGGTTVHHGMGYHRGNARDYSNWVEMGNVGWSWNDVLPFFKKSEDNKEIDRVGDEYHGTGGPMNVERFPWQPPLAESILDAAEETGYGTTEDMVGNKITGFTIAQTLTKDGVRQSSARAFLWPIRDRKNLDITVNATATKIIMRNKTVQEVEYIINGKVGSAKVRHEVVISGGTVNSPQLLLLSGIGPAAELESMAIPVVHDLPGVGKNVHNHVAFALDFTVYDKHLMRYNTEDVDQYLANQTGPLSSLGLSQVTGILASKHTTPDDPDIQIFFSGYLETCLFDILGNVHLHKNYLRLLAVNLHTKSRGTITLASKDPLDHPIIWSNDLGDPADIEGLIEGIHVILRIANSTVMQSKGMAIATKPIEECSQYTFMSDDYFRCAVMYDTKTENHQSGSCKMGPASDPMAVVDPQLRVHGIEGLRVADCSIMPHMISGNPHATVTMIGERAADFIKKTYKKSRYY